MKNEKEQTDRLKEHIRHAPNAVLPEATADATYTGYEVGLLRLALIYLG
jgi:hypothetical protein